MRPGHVPGPFRNNDVGSVDEAHVLVEDGDNGDVGEALRQILDDLKLHAVDVSLRSGGTRALEPQQPNLGPTAARGR